MDRDGKTRDAFAPLTIRASTPTNVPTMAVDALSKPQAPIDTNSPSFWTRSR
jgi:hypothetical protein